MKHLTMVAVFFAMLFAAPSANAQAGFVVGMFTGALLSSNSEVSAIAAEGLKSIPLRCLAAFDEGEAEYRECRKPSLMAEVVNASRIGGHSDNRPICIWSQRALQAGMNYYGYPWCDIEKPLAWEIKALRQLRDAAKKASQ